MHEKHAPPLINAIEAFASIGVSRTRAYELLNSGAVAACKLGAKTMIRATDWQRYLASLPPYASPKGRVA